MEDINPRLLIIFAKVVDLKGISAASRFLGIPKGTISRALARLESTLDTRLIERSTRKMRLTKSGETLLFYARNVADAIHEAKAALETLDRAGGSIRIASPHTFVQSMIAESLSSFLANFPDVAVEIELTNRVVNPIEEQFDFVIRLGPLPSSSLMAKSLGVVDFAIYAAPSYLEGVDITHPQQLANQKIIDFTATTGHHEWGFVRGGEKVSVRIVPVLAINDPVIRRDAAAEGFGLALLPWWLVHNHVRTGRLKRVLPAWHSTLQTTIYAVYPNRRSLSDRSRSFLKFLEEEISRKLAHRECADAGAKHPRKLQATRLPDIRPSERPNPDRRGSRTRSSVPRGGARPPRS